MKCLRTAKNTMIVEIPYGAKGIVANLPDRTAKVPNVALGSLPPAPDLEGLARDALDHPLGSPAVEGLVKPSSKVVIAFDDPTVASYGPVRGIIIRQLVERMDKAGVARESITLICANSLHRKFRHHELAMMIGQDLVREFGEGLICHDAEDTDNLVYFGKTSGGYDVEVNRRVAEADLTIYVNAGHNRGFSGGWKSVCVGLSTYHSIRHHHTPDGMSMSLTNNRMHEMLDEMGRLLESKIAGRIFKVDTLLADPFRAAKIYAGSVWETRKAVLDTLSNLFPPRRSMSAEKFDVILYGVPNWSPYAIFSSMNPMLTLISSGLGYLGGMVEAVGKPGCAIIMVTPCPNQWDRVHHASYPDVWENVLSRTRDPYEIQRDYAPQYVRNEIYIQKYRNEFAFHPVHAILATYPLKRLKHAGRVIVAGIEDSGVAGHLGFESSATVEDALRMTEESHGKKFSLAYIEQPTASNPNPSARN